MVVHANAPQALRPAEHRIQFLLRGPPVQNFWGRTQTSVGGTPDGAHEDLTLSDLAARANFKWTHNTAVFQTDYVRHIMISFGAATAIDSGLQAWVA